MTMIIMAVQKYSLQFVVAYDAWIWEQMLVEDYLFMSS